MCEPGAAALDKVFAIVEDRSGGLWLGTEGGLSRVDVEGGYDHCYVLNKQPGKLLPLAARVTEPKTGRVMEVHTTQPGVQLYTAKGLTDRLGADGKSYGPYHGFCLETQHFPDSPSQPDFPSTILEPGEEYSTTTVYKFSAK